jgi:hypothetical protein
MLGAGNLRDITAFIPIASVKPNCVGGRRPQENPIRPVDEDRLHRPVLDALEDALGERGHC